jgi:hypothetical protein
MKISDIFLQLSDAQVRQGMQEIQEDWGKTTRKSGIVSKLCQQIYDLTGEHPSVHLHLVKESIKSRYNESGR